MLMVEVHRNDYPLLELWGKRLLKVAGLDAGLIHHAMVSQIGDLFQCGIVKNQKGLNSICFGFPFQQ
ncbi:hypothetical protein ACET3Z_009574 [Daucus carota]